MTHIYYNPDKGLLSTTSKDGYTAFVNAADVARQRDEMKRREAVMKGAMNGLVRDNLHLKVTAELLSSLDEITPVLLGGCTAIAFSLFSDKDPKAYVLVLGVVLCILYVAMKIRYFVLASRKHEAIENMEVGGIEVIRKDATRTSEDDKEDTGDKTGENNSNPDGGAAIGLC